MKVDATTIEEFFAKSGKYEDDLRRLDALIVATAPKMERRLWFMGGTPLLAYGDLIKKHNEGNFPWPVLSCAPQKHYVSLYVAPEIDGEPILTLFDGRLGKISASKWCVRFKQFDDLDQQGIRALIRESIIAAKNHERA